MAFAPVSNLEPLGCGHLEHMQSNKIDMGRLGFMQRQLGNALKERLPGKNLMTGDCVSVQALQHIETQETIPYVIFLDVVDKTNEFGLLNEGIMRLRIIVMNRTQLVTATSFAFVGFFGFRRELIKEEIRAGIKLADEQLIRELPSHSEIFGYCTLESSSSDPCNLVIIRSDETKLAWAASRTHVEAVIKLAPYYYKSIRIHNGYLSQQNPPILLRTKFYDFADYRLSMASCEYATTTEPS
jgi:hypothetical protein